MRSEWKEVAAENYCLSVRDGTHDSPKQTDSKESRFLITSKHLQDYTLDFNSAYRISMSDYLQVIERSKVDQWDILFSMIGTIGKIYQEKNLHPDYAIKNVGLFKMGGDKQKSEWLKYYLLSPKSKEYIQSQLRGSTQGYVPLGALRQMPVTCPSLPEQRAIASTLSCLDDKIELNNKINANLEAQAQAIFKSWFVDFEPFQDGEFIDSELGMIPKGWRVGKLGELVNVKYGKDHKRLADGNIPVYGSGGIMRYAEKALYDKESVLIPRKGTLNNVIYINEPFWTVDTMFYTEMNQPNIAKFVYYFVCDWDLASMNAGSAVPSMTTDILNNLPVIIAPNEIYNDFELIVSPIFKALGHTQKQSRTLAAVRDALLPKLMSGEITPPVGDADIPFSEGD